MKKNYKIITTYSANLHEYVITLHAERKWWVFKWWVPELQRSGTYRDIAHYKEAWLAEYGLTDRDYEETTV